MSLSPTHPAVNAALLEYWWRDPQLGPGVESVPAAYRKITEQWNCRFVGDGRYVRLEFNNPADETAFLLRYS